MGRVGFLDEGTGPMVLHRFDRLRRKRCAASLVVFWRDRGGRNPGRCMFEFGVLELKEGFRILHTQKIQSME